MFNRTCSSEQYPQKSKTLPLHLLCNELKASPSSLHQDHDVFGPLSKTTERLLARSLRRLALQNLTCSPFSSPMPSSRLQYTTSSAEQSISHHCPYPSTLPLSSLPFHVGSSAYSYALHALSCMLLADEYGTRLACALDL
jgi:hypothetical protein